MNASIKYSCIIGGVLVLGALVLYGVLHGFLRTSCGTIKVGVLYSLTNSYMNEQLSVDAVLMAIDEINKGGGVLGCSLEPVVADCQESDELYAKLVQKLIEQDHVACIFAGGSCSARRTGAKVVDRLNNILLYARQAEGLIQTPSVIYMGSTLNQTIIPAVTWALKIIGNKFFIIGSEDLLSHIADEMIQKQANSLGATIVGMGRLGDNSADVEKIIADIASTKPSIIFNTMSGKANIMFYDALHAAGITAEDIPTLSLNSDENELKFLLKQFIGGYTVSGYFQSIDNPKNKEFIQRFKDYYNRPDAIMNNTAQSSYCGVYIWAQTAKQIGSVKARDIIPAIRRQVFNGPAGVFFVDINQYGWNKVLIGKALYTGQFSVVWGTHDVIHPEPYPPYKDSVGWHEFTAQLYKKWGNSWSHA